jgi:predicted CXXCH cytochrome family protein
VGGLCLSCHPALAAEIEKAKIQHVPAMDGMCLKCHVPHYANSEGLLAGVGMSLCKNCHDPKDKNMADAHHGIPTETTDCIGCHEAHSAENKGLMHKVMHAPFKDGKCDECH